MTRTRSILALALVATSTLPSCGNQGSGDEAYVMAPDEVGNYAIRRRTLPVRDVRTLANDAFAFETRSRLFLDAEPVHTEDPHPVDLQLVESDGAYAAGDYDALLALSAAHHLFVARRHFDDVGLASISPPFPVRRVVLFPYREQTGATAVPLEDNAFFMAALGGFAILRENVLDAQPLATNLGVLAHEFSHAVFSHLVGRMEEGPAIELLFRGLNEGLADVHGAAASNDPAFVQRSAPHLGTSRDPRGVRVYDPNANALALQAGDPYWYGAVVSSTFWDYRRRLIGERAVDAPEATSRMSRAAFRGVADFTIPSTPDGVLTLDELEREFWAGFAGEAERTGDRDLFCAAVVDHFAQRSDLYQGVCP